MMKKFSKYSDAELFDAFSEKKKTAELAFAEFYSRYSDTLWKYIRKYVGNAEDVNDLFQEVFVKFFESGKEKKGMVDNPKSFLYIIARNHCINYYRTNKEQTVFIEGTVADHDSDYGDKQLSEIIHNEILKLKIEDREPLVLKYYQGMSVREIAKVIDKDEDYVRVRIWRARKKLVKNLKPYIRELKMINNIVLE